MQKDQAIKQLNNMTLTNDQAKIDIVGKLVKEGAIDFTEAIKLLEVEKDFSFTPFQPIPTSPWDRIGQPWPAQFPTITYQS